MLKGQIREQVRSYIREHLESSKDRKNVDEMFDPLSVAVGVGAGSAIGAGLMALLRKLRTNKKKAPQSLAGNINANVKDITDMYDLVMYTIDELQSPRPNVRLVRKNLETLKSFVRSPVFIAFEKSADPHITFIVDDINESIYAIEDALHEMK